LSIKFPGAGRIGLPAGFLPAADYPAGSEALEKEARKIKNQEP
jgi:hypothetical protein